jgi:hypothetical protein
MLVKMSSKLMVLKSDLVAAGLPTPQKWCEGAVRSVRVGADKCRKAAAEDVECDVVEMLPANRVLPDLHKYADVYRACLGKGCGEVKELADFPKAALSGVCHSCAGTERETGTRTCIECGVARQVTSFDKGRRTCTRCRNGQDAQRNFAKAAANSSLRICCRCNVAKASDKFASAEINGCLACSAKDARRTS